MGIANEVEIRLAQDEDRKFSFEDEFLKRYPGLCPQCGSQICTCPSLPQATIGRMAKELGMPVVSELFNPEPDTFAEHGKEVASRVLERAGGYAGLAASFPFDRGDANRALVMLCIGLGDLVAEQHPELATKFRGAAMTIGDSAAPPGSRGKAVDVTEILELIKSTWRNLSTDAKEKLENRKDSLVVGIGSLLGKVRVLFVYCSPTEASRIRGDRELRAIREAIKVCGRNADIDVSVLTAATPDDLRRELLIGEFEIVHFAGHSDGEFLVFEDERGESNDVPLKALAELIRNYPAVRCVILNACESGKNLTVPISEYTIGMNGSVDDEAAIEFSRGFYDAIAAGRQIDFAVGEGRRCAELKGLTVPITMLR